MKERQQHGFIYQSDVAQRYHIQETTNYTDAWDGYTEEGIPVSIKLEKYGTDVEMADYFRNANHVEDFLLIVGFWENSKDNIVEEHILYINGEDWHSQFPEHFSYEFRTLLDNITNDYSDDAAWRQAIGELRNKWKTETHNLIRPRFKRDHGHQKRIQCAINNKDFYNYWVVKYEGGK